MTLRSQQTCWFEVFVRREQVVYALEALAGTHSVQLELDPRFSGALHIEDLLQQIREFDQLAECYRSLLPDSSHRSTRLTGPPDELAGHMLCRLRRWSGRIEPLLAQSEVLKARRKRLQLLQEAAIAMGESASQLPHIAHGTELLFKALYRCTVQHDETSFFEDLLEQSFDGEDHSFVVIACLPGQRDEVIRLLSQAGCEEVEIPDDLVAQNGHQLQDIRQRLDKAQADFEQVEGQVRALRNDPQIAEALANIDILRWFTGAAHHVGIQDAEFCRITGWTSEPDPERLETVLQHAHVEAEVRFARPPASIIEPVAGAASWWRQPFQIFTVMWGAPSADEIDPTGLLAIVVPLRWPMVDYPWWWSR